MTSFALLVLGAPASSQSVATAFEFANAAIGAGHTVLRVFFYGDGVYTGSDQQIPASGTEGIPERWRELAELHKVDLVVCVASALKRGVLDGATAQRYAKGEGNLAASFDLSGLGVWTEACLLADRVVSFGP